MVLRYVLLLLSFLFSLKSYAQSQIDSLPGSSDTTYTLIGDTLFSNLDFKIFIGQPIVVGKASGERDWYNTISFKSGASWPLLFLKKTETDQNLEYQMDPSIREKDKVKEYVSPGDTLIITKINRFGKKRFGYRYMVSMGQKQGFLSLNFKCDIISAIKTKEVFLPKM